MQNQEYTHSYDPKILSNIPQRHRLIINIIQQLYDEVSGLKILDVACGHNFPVISWVQDNNAGPVLAGYLGSQDAKVTGLDQLHFRKSNEFRESDFLMKWGMAENVGKYFSNNSFDIVISCAYFGYPSSRNGTRPNYQKEHSIMEQLYGLTKEGGQGIHLLIDGYWQLYKEDLTKIGYDVQKYLGEEFSMCGTPFEKRLLDNIILVKKPFSKNQ